MSIFSKCDFHSPLFFGEVQEVNITAKVMAKMSMMGNLISKQEVHLKNIVIKRYVVVNWVWYEI